MQENMLNDKRRMWKLIIFGGLTFGIYAIIFWWNMIKDMNRACGYVEQSEDDKSPNYIVLCLLTMITFGIYNYFWYYKQGNRLKRVGSAYGLEIDEKGSTYLLWILLGSLLFGIGPLVALSLFIGNVNKVCRLYNYNMQNGQGGAVNDGYDNGGYAPAGNGGYIEDNGYNNAQPGGDNNVWSESTYYGLRDDAPTKGFNTQGGLRFIQGAYAGAEIELQPGMELVIGRNSQMSQLVLPDQDISRKHCSIYFESSDGYYYVTDFSSFGVTINDSQKMAKGVPTKCSSGTKLTLGNGSNIFILK